MLSLDGGFAVHPQSQQTRWMIIATPGGDKSPPSTTESERPAAPPPPSEAELNNPALRIEPGEYQRLIADGTVLTVDVRGSQDYADGHLPDAVSIPLDAVEQQAATLAAGGKAVVIYCS